MTSQTRSSRLAFLTAVISLVMAVTTGVSWLGAPFRPVQLVTLIGLSMAAGVSWTHAVLNARRR